jgi:hypothetical protein
VAIVQGVEEPLARARIGLGDPDAGGGEPFAAAIDLIEGDGALPRLADQDLAVDVAAGKDQVGGATGDPAAVPDAEKPTGAAGKVFEVAPDRSSTYAVLLNGSCHAVKGLI